MSNFTQQVDSDYMRPRDDQDLTEQLLLNTWSVSGYLKVSGFNLVHI